MLDSSKEKSMQTNRSTYLVRLLIVIVASVAFSSTVLAQDTFADAEIVNDEGGAVVIQGTMTISNPNVKQTVAQPLVILEDQAGFVARNQGYLFPLESQVLGQYTSDYFADGPTSYSISLPIEPQGTFVDVDNDGSEDVGVQIFTPAYWNNAFGGPFLEPREQAGFGWSGAYAGTNISDDPNHYLEVVGGRYVVYAPDDQQGFPAGFGADRLLFSEDDPIVGLPQGYTMVIMDTDPFTFDRSNVAEIELLEPESVPFDDFSDLGYTDAFNALVDKAINEYAFTDFYGIDWEALRAEFLPRVEEAEANNDVDAYTLALNEFALAISDGHVAVIPSTPILGQVFRDRIGGGIGLALVELDDGRVLTNFVTDGSPAALAGVEVGAEILSMHGLPIDEAIASTEILQAQSAEFAQRLQQLRYVTRAPLGSDIEITYANAGAEAQTTTLTTVSEVESWFRTSWYDGYDNNALPVTFDILDSGYGVAHINGFTSNEVLTIQTWEFFFKLVQDEGLLGVIVDMRQNPGGFPFMSDQMSAYFFNEERVVGNRGSYNDDIGEFFFNEELRVRLFPPPQEELQYMGPVAVLIGPGCASACERFAYNLSLRDNTEIIGHYPTAGLGGGVEEIAMPDSIYFNMTVVRSVNADNEIHIEGQGVAPTIQIPLDEATVFSDEDVLLNAAIDWLDDFNGR
jgi:C-terminal processing protease CtpA/Prc